MEFSVVDLLIDRPVTHSFSTVRGANYQWTFKTVRSAIENQVRSELASRTPKKAAVGKLTSKRREKRLKNFHHQSDVDASFDVLETLFPAGN